MTENDHTDPFLIIQEWLNLEKECGSVNPHRIILATSNLEGVPHSRVVAIREITSQGILFFTQQITRKVEELQQNPKASMTLWLAQQQRQVILEGYVNPLSPENNEKYWFTMAREQQLRFSVYAESSGQKISSASFLENKLTKLIENLGEKPVPLSRGYCGFHFIAQTIQFYTLRSDTFSEVLRYRLSEEKWSPELLSP